MTKLTDKEKKQMIADYIDCQNFREVARKHNRSVNTIRRVVNANKDIEQIVTQKKKENTLDILSFMDEQNEKIQNTLEALLLGMNYKATYLDEKATIKDLATAYGIILDKQFKIIELSRGSANSEQLTKVQELLSKLDKEAQNDTK